MPYIDQEYYENDYLGRSTGVDSFLRLANRASETIDILTNHKLLGVDFDSLNPVIKNQVMKATAMQVEYLIVGGAENDLGAGSFGQVSAGNFSYGDKPGKDTLSRSQQMTTQKVVEVLASTGLLYTGVDTL